MQIAFLLHDDDQVKEAVLKWLYEPTENVIRHLLGGIKQLVKESDTSPESKTDFYGLFTDFYGLFTLKT
jgi:hypothetical protein